MTPCGWCSRSNDDGVDALRTNHAHTRTRESEHTLTLYTLACRREPLDEQQSDTRRSLRDAQQKRRPASTYVPPLRNEHELQGVTLEARKSARSSMATSLGATGASAATTDVAVGAPTMDRDASSTGGGAAPRSTCTPTPATVSSLEGAEASPGEEERARSSGELSASSSADVGLQADLRSSSGGGTASDDELDPVLAKALSHPRDRLLLLRAERELIKLIDSPTCVPISSAVHTKLTRRAA